MTFLLALFSLAAGERLLLAAENQVIEINRAGKVTGVWKHPGHVGIWDAWRLPDGGLFYSHRNGLAVFDKNKKLVLEHASQPGGQSPGGAVLRGGRQFALLDSAAAEIRVIDRKGKVVSRTPVPGIEAGNVAARYRMIRESARGDAFWVAQYQRNTLLEVETGTGRILTRIVLEPHLNASPLHRAFATLEPGDGTLYATTATGLQLLRFDAQRNRTGSWTAKDLGLTTRYLLGMQRLANGNLMIALGDYHLKSPAEAADQLAEVTPEGKTVWKLTREQLVDQIEGFVDPRTKLEEMRIANVHVYDHNRLKDCLRVKR